LAEVAPKKLQKNAKMPKTKMQKNAKKYKLHFLFLEGKKEGRRFKDA
jgi:hypothetical protein